MKKITKILTGSFLVASALTAVVVTPIEIAKNNNSATAPLTSNIPNKQIISTKNINIGSILSEVPENKVENPWMQFQVQQDL